MSLPDFLNIFETLANEKRLEIYIFILNNYFVSKSELAIEMGMNRASLNHHLKSLIGAHLVKEIELNLEGKRQYFVFILKKVNVDDLVEEIPDSLNVSSILEQLENKYLSFDSWSEIRQLFELIDNNFLQAIETRLFKHVSKIGSTCSICNNRTSISICKSCLTPLCKNCQHVIKTETGIITLCQKCIQQYFG